MVPVGNKAKCLSLAKTFAKAIHQSLIMQHFFLSGPWDLLGSKLWIIFKMSSCENVIDARNWSVLVIKSIGSLMLFCIMQHSYLLFCTCFLHQHSDFFNPSKIMLGRPVRILWNILKFWKVWALFWCLYSWYWTGIRWLLRLVLEVFLYLCNVFFSKLYVQHFPIVKIAGY